MLETTKKPPQTILIFTHSYIHSGRVSSARINIGLLPPPAFSLLFVPFPATTSRRVLDSAPDHHCLLVLPLKLRATHGIIYQLSPKVSKTFPFLSRTLLTFTLAQRPIL